MKVKMKVKLFGKSKRGEFHVIKGPPIQWQEDVEAKAEFVRRLIARSMAEEKTS